MDGDTSNVRTAMTASQGARPGWFSRPSLVTTLVALLTVVMFATGCADASTTTQQNPSATSGEIASTPANEPIADHSEPTPAAEPEPEPEPESAVSAVAVNVIRIIDGDTIEVRMPDGTAEKVRFIGVDTPESTTRIEPYGQQATAYTADALAGKTIYLETDAELRDRYGRMLAHVWLTEPSVVNDSTIRAQLFNAMLVLDGYANLMTIPPNVKYVDFLKGYQGEARQAAVGLWAPQAPVVAAPATPGAPSGTSGAYIANKNTKKFHYASCSSVGDMNESNKVPYSSRDTAVRDGYVPCKRCNP
ncbi:MAG: thermonuclease family protein [Coriobacteriia bacterium]|nr:thermonuclease family protein [Coriobacteriia bacterium]